MGGALSCPSEFIVSPAGTACVLPCPAPKGYYLNSQGAVLSCAYISNPTVQVELRSTPMYMAGVSANPGKPGPPAGASYKDLENKDVYKAEIERFDAAMTVADASVSNDVKIANAFAALQAAEDARGTPAGEAAYETARIAYYTLKKGPTWASEEQTRIANVEAQPVVDDLVARYNALKEKQTQQASTIEVINGLKDRVLSVKDDLAFSVNTFQRQVEAVRNQIAIDKKNQADSIQITTSWFDAVLNWLIAIVTILCIVLLVRRFAGGRGSIEKMQRETEFYRAKASLENAKKGILPTKTPNLYELFGLEKPAPAAPKPAAAPAAPAAPAAR